jgi:PAS domain S-box-containing protein
MGTTLGLLDATSTTPASSVTEDANGFRQVAASADEYAIFLLAPDGTVMTWNPGAERLKGFRGPDIVGRHFRVFYLPEDIAAGKPERELAEAQRDGVYVDNGWRIRQDGTKFWAHVVITPLYDGPNLRGFAKVTRDDTAARAATETARALTSITRAVLDGADVIEVLAMVTTHACDLTGAGRSWLVTPQGTGFVVRAADGRLPGPPVGELLPGDTPMTGVMRVAQPQFVADMRSSNPGPTCLDKLGAGLLVPMIAGTATLGILVAAAPSRSAAFRAVELDVLQALANQAALVLTHQRAQQALHQRQVGDDRERIARDLHDHVIQQLFGTGMGLQSAAGHTRDAGLKMRIEEAVDHLDVTIRQIRTTIFDLHEPDPRSSVTPRAQIVALVHDASRALTFRPVLNFEGPIDTVIAQDTCEHLLAALREMLSNVARHARASAATVSVTVGPDVELTVTDDGDGPPAHPETGSGLRNLRSRARALNGTFTLVAAPGCGAVATVRIPL